jgi:hypothetical protein
MMKDDEFDCSLLRSHKKSNVFLLISTDGDDDIGGMGVASEKRR